MTWKALRGLGLVCVLCVAPSAMAQDANAPDCAIGVPLSDGATCQPGGKTCPNECKVQADYSSAMSCCGPLFQVECQPAGSAIPCNDVCDHSWCVPDSLLANLSGTAAAALPDCNTVAPDGARYKCVPEGLGESLGNIMFKTCNSIGGGEGRCIPSCLNQVKDLSKYLPTDPACLSTELCVPCYDPRTGAATGACSIGCDTGPNASIPKVVFQPCCAVSGGDAGKDAATDAGPNFTGMCVSKTIVDSVVAGASAIFSATDCTQTANTVCVPRNLDISQLGSFACLKTATGGTDSGTPPDASAGGTSGSGGTTGSGGTKPNLDSGIDAGSTPRSKDEGSCSCRIGSEPSNGRGAVALTLVGLTAAFARGRRRARRAAR